MLLLPTAAAAATGAVEEGGGGAGRRGVTSSLMVATLTLPSATSDSDMDLSGGCPSIGCLSSWAVDSFERLLLLPAHTKRHHGNCPATLYALRLLSNDLQYFSVQTFY